MSKPSSVYFENEGSEEEDGTNHVAAWAGTGGTSMEQKRDPGTIATTGKIPKNVPPTKFKYLWICLTGPARLYRRFEWWIITKLLESKAMNRVRMTLRLHEKYRGNRSLGLLYYFRDVATQTKPEDTVKVDLAVVRKLIAEGADVHACDDIGQNLMHEIARYHGAEVCFFFLNYSVNINLEDDYSCTPLHVAAAFNNSAIVEILASNGGDLESTTFYMLQTSLHYAARYDSPSSVKKLIEMGAEIEARDYRGRTPLLLAAELGRMSAGAMLLDCGAKVYAIDFTGMYGISAMVNKCPPLALKALDTCVEKDLRNRREYFSLQFLEPITLCNDECAKTTFTVLEETVRAGNNELDIIKHPIIQKLIEVKWHQFGERGYRIEVASYLIVLLNWSLLCFFNPINSNDTIADTKVAIVNECLTVLFFLYQVFDEIRELRLNVRRHKRFVTQRLKQLEMEFKYLELLSEEEKQYLRKEQETVRKSRSFYAKDSWNVFDWFSIFLMFITLVVHFTIKYKGETDLDVERGILISVTVVLVWMKLFKYCRVLEKLGPFCVIISSMPKDIGKIAIVYIILYIPMVCSFYHMFSAESGGDYASNLTDNSDFNEYKYGDLYQCCFTVFRYMLVDDYGYDSLKLISEYRNITLYFTKSLIAYWLIASSVLLLNLFIALLSDTFSRVYENALVVSQFERAAMIVSIENKLPQYWRKFHLLDISYNYAPASAFYDDDEVRDDEQTTFEQDVETASTTLRRLLKEKQDATDEDLNEFLKVKIKSQTDLIDTLIRRIEALERK